MCGTKKSNGESISKYLTQDTIAAISTPPGHGGVGMVRISGPEALNVGRAVFTPAGSGLASHPEPRKAIVGHVHHPDNPDDPIDQALWLAFTAPRSFTGEDTVEITAHGGPLIMKEILNAVVLAGARLAEPGEFTKRAFLNGKIDLAQAESVASLIFAATEEARRVMRNQVEGAMGRKVEDLRKRLLEIKVALESSLDFPEDVGEVDAGEMLSSLSYIIENIEKILFTSVEGIALAEGISVIIAGAPNVGKSSLLNALLEEERALVHETPGTTRDFIEGRISVGGIPMVVVDTAGIRDLADPLENQGIKKTKDLMKQADLLLFVMDGSRAITPEEHRVLNETKDIKRVVGINKIDIPAFPEKGMPDNALKISALTGEGIDALKRAIHDTYTGSGQSLTEADAVVTTIRQKAALERALAGCKRVREALAGSSELELAAVDLNEALLGIGELTGEITVDEVLEEIFSKFCIGK